MTSENKSAAAVEHMIALKKLAECEHARRTEAADAHLPLYDANNAPIVTFSPAGVSAEVLETTYLHKIVSQSASNNEVEVGLLYLSTPHPYTILHLDKINVYKHFGNRGFGLAAMRHLVSLARVSGYQKIVGELSPEHPDRLKDLIRFYEATGFTVSGTGSSMEVSRTL